MDRYKMEYKPRQATDEELLELEEYLEDEMNGDDALGLVERSCISVFDHYISEGPGYMGKVMMVVYRGECYFDVYAWYDGVFTRVDRN